MKKLLVLLFAILLVAGCSNDSADKDKDKTKETNEEASESTEEEGKFYPMNQPVKITVVEYDLPFEITVNSFEISKKFKGKPMSDFFEHDFSSFALSIINVTIKNVSDQAFVPSEKTSPNLNFDGKITPPEDLSPKLDEKLKPGEKISEDLVFLSSPDADKYILSYGFGTKNETEFLLPTPD